MSGCCWACSGPVALCSGTASLIGLGGSVSNRDFLLPSKGWTVSGYSAGSFSLASMVVGFMADLSEVGTLFTAGMVAFGSVLNLFTPLARTFPGSVVFNGSSVTVPFRRSV